MVEEQRYKQKEKKMLDEVNRLHEEEAELRKREEEVQRLQQEEKLKQE